MQICLPFFKEGQTNKDKQLDILLGGQCDE